MLSLALPWFEQPQVAVAIDLANPLTARITHLLPLNGDPRELVTGARLTYGAGGSQAVSIRGRALQGSGAAACASVPIDLSPYTKASVSFWMYWDAYANDDKLAMEYGANYATNSGFLIDPNSGAPASGNFQCGVGSPSATNAWQFTRPSAAAWHHYVFLFDRTTGTLQSTTIYVDGVALAASAAGATNDVTDQFGNNSLYIFSRNNTSLFGAGKLQNLVIRGGYLMSAAEARQEYNEPWSLFEPRRLFIPAAVVGGAQASSGGSSAVVTVTAAGAGSAQAAGGASAVATVSAAGSGISAERASGGASSAVAVSAAGAGTAREAATGGAAAAVVVTVAGAGSVQASGGAAATVTVTAAGAGASSQGASGGASASVVVAAVGAGSAVEAAAGGSSASVVASEAGTGVGREFVAGGSSVPVIVTVTGAGTAREAVTSGAAAAVVVAVAGAGSVQAAGGAAATVTVTAAGAGASSQGASGGASASVVVAAVGAGSAVEAAAGGSSASVVASEAGAGSGREFASGGGAASILVAAAGGGADGAAAEPAARRETLGGGRGRNHSTNRADEAETEEIMIAEIITALAAAGVFA